MFFTHNAPSSHALRRLLLEPGNDIIVIPFWARDYSWVMDTMIAVRELDLDAYAFLGKDEDDLRAYPPGSCIQ